MAGSKADFPVGDGEIEFFSMKNLVDYWFDIICWSKCNKQPQKICKYVSIYDTYIFISSDIYFDTIQTSDVWPPISGSFSVSFGFLFWDFVSLEEIIFKQYSNKVNYWNKLYVIITVTICRSGG